MAEAPKDGHYTRLYSARHFRNRIIRLQQMCADANLDAILLIAGTSITPLPPFSSLLAVAGTC